MIVSCGEALVDLVPDPVPGGGPMNVAVAAARLGVPSAFIGRISTDEHGGAIVDHLRANGVDLRACERGPEPTARAVVEHVPHLVFRFEGTDTADTNLTEARFDMLDDGPRIVHGGTLGMFRGRTAETLALAVEAHDGIVSFDPNVRPQIIDDRSRWDHYHRRWCAVAHVVKASDEDLAWIWPGRSTASCAEHLLAGAAMVVIATRGADGATVFTANDEVEIPGAPVEVVDTVGAGDTFVATVLAELWRRDVAAEPQRLGQLTRRDWHEIGHRAVVAAGITCSRRGADPPTAADLDRAIVS